MNNIETFIWDSIHLAFLFFLLDLVVYCLFDVDLVLCLKKLAYGIYWKITGFMKSKKK